MRRLPQASATGTTSTARGAQALIASCALALLALLLGAGPASAACPNEAFRGGLGATLAECRAFEMVSPPSKNNSNIDGLSTIRVSPDGNGVFFPSTNGFAGGETSLVVNYYRAVRGASQWSTENPDAGQLNEGGFVVRTSPSVSADLDKTLQVSLRALAPGAVEGNGNFYLRDNLTGARTLVATGPPGLFTGTGGLSGNGVAGTSEDLSHIFLSSSLALTPDAIAGVPNLYEWTAQDGLELASVLPNGSPASSGVNTEARLRAGSAVSADGTRVVFRDLATNFLYVRVNGEVTKKVSVSQRTGSVGTQVFGELATISRDGSGVLFRTQGGPLTDDPGASDRDIYRYDVGTGALQDLTLPSDPSKTSDVSTVGLLGSDESGSRIYFKASGVLAPGAVEGKGNLYESNDDGAQLIATFDENSALEGFGMSGEPSFSPDGRYFTFRSFQSPTGYDNQSPDCPEIAVEFSPPGSCAEVYTYDADTQELKCASCNPNPAAVPIGHAFLKENTYQINYTARSTLNDGRVFFMTEDSLVPQDVNRKMDVYQWREGEVTLISTGTSVTASTLADVTPDGSSVLFTTRQRLVPQDADENVDLYSARIDGGLPGQQFNPEFEKAGCEGEACKGPATSGASASAPATAAFEGPANGSTPRKRCPKARKGGSKAKSSKAKCRKAPSKKKKRTTKRSAKRANGTTAGSGK